MKAKIDLRYNLMDAHMLYDNTERPSKVIERLGIKYERWEPHPIADQIILRGCSNVPEKLPDWIKIIK